MAFDNLRAYHYSDSKATEYANVTKQLARSYRETVKRDEEVQHGLTQRAADSGDSPRQIGLILLPKGIPFR